jgi:hypothetical protein
MNLLQISGQQQLTACMGHGAGPAETLDVIRLPANAHTLHAPERNTSINVQAAKPLIVCIQLILMRKLSADNPLEEF